MFVFIFVVRLFFYIHIEMISCGRKTPQTKFGTISSMGVRENEGERTLIEKRNERWIDKCFDAIYSFDGIKQLTF